MWEFVARFFRTRYVRMLEGEVARLRAENRALVNSLLGTAGIAPLEAPVAPAVVPRVRKRSWFQVAAEKERASGR